MFLHRYQKNLVAVDDRGALRVFHKARMGEGQKVTEVFSRTRNGEGVKITITLTNELPPTSPTCLQFYNIIFRRLLKMLNLQQIGRNYYNASDPISIPNHRLMVWPGFTSSILQYEESIMLCTDVSHKVLRSETVLDFMYSLYYQVEEQRFRDACAKELIGLIVLTKYNNRTYRVDDIDWDANPQCTFRKADGSEISYVDYYKRGKVPEDWRKSNVIPILKKFKEDDMGNYRPVSLALTPGKAVEQLILETISRHMNNKKVIRSNEGRAVDVVYLDFSKAFNTVSRKILTEKLMKCGLNEQTMKSIESWLNGQAQTVVIGGTVCSWSPQYNQEITDLNQPVLISQSRRKRGSMMPGPVVLIPELCFLTGLTEKMRNDFNMMKDLAIHTRLPPEQRQREIRRLIDYIQKDDNVQKELRDWGLSFDSNLLSFTGRVVQGEKILQSGNVFDYNPQFADWSKETRGAPLICAKPLDNWLLIYTRRNYDIANTLLQNLFKVTPSMGIRMNKATMIEVDDRTEAYLRVLQQSITPDTNIAVCVLSSSRKDKYDAIKKYLCTDCPIPSQCVIARTLSKPQTAMAIATKIALQMNCKMGGELWSVEIPLKQVMIVGIDCYHDTLSGKQSIAGFVASLNQTMTRWFSRCAIQGRGQELVDGLKACLQTALRDWFKWNKYLPSRIIVYRDGVGDGQLNTLVNYEVPQFLDCLKSVGKDYNPRLTVIVVKKRVNTRFFAQCGGALKNPPPGTVVDVEVTRPEWYDFFIVSQAVRNGCVAPTHYNVIYDTSKLKPDHVQRLTYKLCHMYYNWSGVIRVPAPCQYAHKLAFLVGQSIHKEPNLLLSDRLYYL
ncbi:hypothetical protein QYF61_023982 [Mycteria americana]|uniref:PIWL1 protein n=1 Tax=Mycteria americana TaxID=33587 RepID=A0AAN7ND41_MYCAM|nr:hypothetical protein QYF61_023982 [Mycteria americana]